MAFKLKKVITGWDSDVVDIAFSRSFAYGKIGNKQWRHLSRLILEGIFTIKDWTAGKLALFANQLWCIHNIL